jgi:hypothetical protein
MQMSSSPHIFLAASAVEMVEALTIVLAVGVTRLAVGGLGRRRRRGVGVIAPCWAGSIL